MLKVSKHFLRDFAELANRYEWSDADIAEIKQQTRDNPTLIEYWKILAQAHRNGYIQSRANNYKRLEQWYQEQGKIWPF